MNFENLMRQRYSTRAFLSDPVPPGIIRHILDVAQKSPSWCNTQPWEVVVTQTPSATQRLREQLCKHAASRLPAQPDQPFPREYVGVHDERRKQCGAALYDALGIGRDDREARTRQTLRNYAFFGAPHAMLVFCHESLGFYGGVDCGVYIHAFMLAALDQGVHSIAQASLAAYPDLIRDHFEIPADRKLLFGCAFGYADEHHPVNRYRTERAAITHVVRYVR
ncbi:nitroreductase [Aquisalimonas sp.]|uniref:nitroreductase n=1 Tax=Aquisalimonas sp. TaxID=1872621 RepID=UPI0025C119FE|nr:nitroreductase [Aquisalimonas sp.]